MLVVIVWRAYGVGFEKVQPSAEIWWVVMRPSAFSRTESGYDDNAQLWIRDHALITIVLLFTMHNTLHLYCNHTVDIVIHDEATSVSC